MQVRLLGPIDVTVDGVHRPVRGLRRKAVLAVLAIQLGEIVSTDRIADVVWGDEAPATALNTLQHHVAHLRQVLGSKDAILARPPGYVLALDDDATDVAVAERLIHQGTQAADRVQGVRHLREALALWRGRPLVDVVGLAGLDTEAERLENLWLLASQALVENRLQLGEHAQLIPDLERMTRDHPHDERFHAQLMLAQYRSGRPADALVTYHRLKRTFGEDLGLDPGQTLRELEAAILRQDATLDLTPPITVGTAPAPGPVPAQLPLAVRGFTGHANDLARLDALLTRAGDRASGAPAVVICAVSGPPGIGKTSLAVHWAHRVADRFPDGQLYVNLRGFDPGGSTLDAANVLRGFLDAFKTSAEQMPAGLDAQATLYRSVLAGKRVLIVLDNARDAEQVRPLLPGTTGCLVIVTSRNQLTPLVAAEGAHPFALDLLTTDEARDLLAARLGADRVVGEPDAVAEIIARCARLPLALAIAAAHAATRAGSPLAVQAAQLRDAAGGLDAFDGGDPATDVRTVFSWSYRALHTEAARLFRVLGLHPGADLAAPAAASVAGLTLSRVRPLLRQLVQANLLIEHMPGRYRFHDLLRSYATEQAHAVDSETDRRDATHRALDHYLHTAQAAVLLLDPGRKAVDLAAPEPGVTILEPSDREQALAWFAAEHAVLLATINLGAGDRFDEHVWKLAWSLTTYFDWRGNWDDLIATQTAALDALQRLDEVSGRAHAHRDIGRTFARLARYDDADTHLGEALRLYEVLDDIVGQARTRHNIGWMYQVRGRYREALTHSECAFHLFQTAGDRLWQARTLNATGWLHGRLGHHRQSLMLCQQALTLMQELQDRHGEAGTWDSLGFAHDRLGDRRAASRCYQQAVDLFGDLGDRCSEAEALVHLGDTHDAAGDRGAASDAWRRALHTFESLGHAGADEARRRLHRQDQAMAG